MVEILMLLGFMLAAYSVVGNDSIQTLGTFLYSNSHRPWWVLWIYSSTIMVAVILYGWFNYSHDPSYSRLNKVYGKSIAAQVEALEEANATALAALADDPAVAGIVTELETLRAEATTTRDVFTQAPEQLDGQLEKWRAAANAVRTSARRGDIAHPYEVTLKVVVEKIDALEARMVERRNVSQFINWKFLLPSFALLLLTRFGFPVSTSFLVLITFQPAVLQPMLFKSLSGYLLAFAVAIVIYLTVARFFEKRWKEEGEVGIKPIWVVLQWCSTAFLWCMWLVQDMANIFVYFPRQPDGAWIAFAIVWMVAMQAVIYYSHGGKIQKVVTQKTNTHDVRSATIVDFLYGIVLYFFKIQNNVPMSTTWVFLGLLAGREIAFALMDSGPSMKRALKLARKDMVKAGFGLGVSVAIAYMINSI